MKLKIGSTEYDVVIKNEKKGILGINKHKGHFNSSHQEYVCNNEIILYGEDIESQTFWHEVVHVIFAELVNMKIYDRIANKIYHDERLVDKIADMVYEVHTQVKANQDVIK